MLVMLESLPVDLLENLEDLNEEVDDVEVQLDRRHDVLLGTQPGHNHLKKRVASDTFCLLKNISLPEKMLT